MKNLKFLSSSLAAIMLATSAIVPSVAQAEIGASAGVSNFYLWRGLDLSAGEGAPAVWGDLSVSSDIGLYGGIWASSGDEIAGQEYDLYAGWAGEFGSFSIDISYWTYVYPSATDTFTAYFEDVNGFLVDVIQEDIANPASAGDIADLVIGLGFGDFGLTIYEALEDDGDEYRYITADYSYGDFNFLVGVHDFESLDDRPTHIQIGYAYNDNLSFTVSKFVEDADGAVNDEVLFNVGYGFSF